MNPGCWICRSLIVVGVAALLVGAGPADEMNKAGEAAKAAMGDQKMPSPEEMMKMMEEMARPTSQHDSLKKLEGRWSAVVKHRHMPNLPWEESKGVMENRLVLGGRWLQQNYRGEMMGKPFNGLGYMGYDKAAEKFVSLWMDDMMTGCMVAMGTGSADSKVVTLTCEMPDPMTKQPCKMREVCTTVDDDHHKFEMFMVMPDNSDFLSMEINYTRMK